jgi:hypothetical protein
VFSVLRFDAIEVVVASVGLKFAIVSVCIRSCVVACVFTHLVNALWPIVCERLRWCVVWLGIG